MKEIPKEMSKGVLEDIIKTILDKNKADKERIEKKFKNSFNIDLVSYEVIFVYLNYLSKKYKSKKDILENNKVDYFLKGEGTSRKIYELLVTKQKNLTVKDIYEEIDNRNPNDNLHKDNLFDKDKVEEMNKETGIEKEMIYYLLIDLYRPLNIKNKRFSTKINSSPTNFKYRTLGHKNGYLDLYFEYMKSNKIKYKLEEDKILSSKKDSNKKASNQIFTLENKNIETFLFFNHLKKNKTEVTIERASFLKDYNYIKIPKGSDVTLPFVKRYLNGDDKEKTEKAKKIIENKKEKDVYIDLETKEIIGQKRVNSVAANKEKIIEPICKKNDEKKNKTNNEDKNRTNNEDKNGTHYYEYQSNGNKITRIENEVIYDIILSLIEERLENDFFNLSNNKEEKQKIEEKKRKEKGINSNQAYKYYNEVFELKTYKSDIFQNTEKIVNFLGVLTRKFSSAGERGLKAYHKLTEIMLLNLLRDIYKKEDIEYQSSLSYKDEEKEKKLFPDYILKREYISENKTKIAYNILDLKTFKKPTSLEEKQRIKLMRAYNIKNEVNKDNKDNKDNPAKAVFIYLHGEESKLSKEKKLDSVIGSYYDMEFHFLKLLDYFYYEKSGESEKAREIKENFEELFNEISQSQQT